MFASPRSPRGPLRRILAVAALALLTLSGCGRTGTVTGKVTLDGQPLKAGTVAFSSADGKKRTSSAPITDGQFTLTKVPTGPGTFTVNTSEVSDYLEKTERAAHPPGTEKMKPAERQQIQQTFQKELTPDMEKRFKGAQLVPPKYANPKTSGLTFTVQSGSQNHDLPLTSQGAAPSKGPATGKWPVTQKRK
jgi:hypothetical protein